jgi:hypothetical protein
VGSLFLILLPDLKNTYKLNQKYFSEFKIHYRTFWQIISSYFYLLICASLCFDILKSFLDCYNFPNNILSDVSREHNCISLFSLTKEFSIVHPLTSCSPHRKNKADANRWLMEWKNRPLTHRLIKLKREIWDSGPCRQHTNFGEMCYTCTKTTATF